jgi:hypothetical protein
MIVLKILVLDYYQYKVQVIHASIQLLLSTLRYSIRVVEYKYAKPGTVLVLYSTIPDIHV